MGPTGARQDVRRGRRRRGAGRGWSASWQLLRILVLLALLAVASFVPILWPVTDPAAPADAVFVLSGDPGERRAIATSLVERGLVPTLVFVGTPDRVTEDEFCQSRQRVEYICLRPQPDNTRTEAQAAARLARSRNWQTIVVVTSKYHVTRSGILFRRCFDGRIKVMGGDPLDGEAVPTRRIVKEWQKVIYTVAVARSC